MIDGMQLHWETKGQMPISVIQRVSKMMFRGVDFLHQKNIVHRDLKGDNLLMNMTHIEDERCCVYLSDFGTASNLLPRERLHERCGTKIYWAPEFYRLDYGFPVDIWALGVIMFGMLKG